MPEGTTRGYSKLFSYFTETKGLFVISGSRRGASEKCALLGFQWRFGTTYRLGR